MSRYVQFATEEPGPNGKRMWFNCAPEHADEIERLLRERHPNVARQEREANPRAPKPWSPHALWTPDLVREHLREAAA